MTLLIIFYITLSLYYTFKSLYNHLKDGTYFFENKLEEVVVHLLLLFTCWLVIPAEFLYFLVKEKESYESN